MTTKSKLTWKLHFSKFSTYLKVCFSWLLHQYTPYVHSCSRSLLQQLQKLQALVSGKVLPRSCKMASTQTGTCLMVGVGCHCWLMAVVIDESIKNREFLFKLWYFLQMMALCFVLVLGSFSPCLSPLSLLSDSPSSSSSPSSRPSSSPLPPADLYTTQSRISLFVSQTQLTPCNMMKMWLKEK